jgi:hypothetical protein
MKKITLLLILIFGYSTALLAQCLTSTTQYPSGASYAIPVCDGLTQNIITTAGWAGEYSLVSVNLGETYTFGSSVATDIITISSDGGTTADTFGTGSVSWVATISGDIKFYTNLVGCGTQNTSRNRYVICGIPPTCIAPTGLVSSNLTTTTATVSWTTSVTDPANGYEFYLSTNNTAPAITDAATDGVVAGITSFDFTGLTSGTNYYIWVRSVCSSTDSSYWSVMGTFATLCEATTVPYIQDFESAVVPALPICTSNENVGLGYNWTTASNPGYGFSTNTLRYTYNFTNPANTWFYTQGIALDAGVSYDISYNYGNNSTFYTESMKVAYGIAPTSADMTDILADHPTITGGVFSGGMVQQNIVSFTPSTSGVYYFGFNAYSIANQFNLYVDDIKIVTTPSCSIPFAVIATLPTNTGATISWTAPANAPASGYEYYLSTTNSSPLPTDLATDGVISGITTVNLTGLTPFTTYYVWVRSVCSISDSSEWSAMVSFTTLPTPPANDDCMNAISITPGGVFTDSPVIGTTVGGTSTTGLTFACQTNRKNDVWYSVVVPASGSLTVETDTTTGTTMTDSVLSVFTGTCGSLTEVGCDDDTGNGNFSRVVLSALTPGSTLYIGVWTFSVSGGGIDGDFQLSAYDASLTSNTFSNSSFMFYPNPVKDVLNISNATTISKVQVVNLLGQEMIVKSMNDTQGQIDMSQLGAGTYLVKLTSDDQIKMIKIIKE